MINTAAAAYITNYAVLTHRGAHPLQASVTRSLPGLLAWAADEWSPGREVSLLVANAVVERWGGLSLPPSCGWHGGSPGPWVTYMPDGDRRRQPPIHLGFVPVCLDPLRFPLYSAAGPNAVRETLVNMETWHRLIGVPWRGTPGVAGTAALRAACIPQRTGGRVTHEPLWQLSLPKYVGTPGERDYDWTSPATQLDLLGDPDEATHLHTYDANRQYLGAAVTAEFARGKLIQAHNTSTAARRWENDHEAGYYLIDPAPWSESEHLVPHPAGPPPRRPKDGVWVTHPTLKLLDDLVDRNDYAGYTILEAWTAPGGRVLRSWAETLRDVPLCGTPTPGLLAAAKAAYRETIGLFARDGGRIHRPDWRHTIIGQARSTLWRRVWATRQRVGRAPLRIHVDAVTYSCTGNCHEAPLPIGTGLGTFKPVPEKATA